MALKHKIEYTGQEHMVMDYNREHMGQENMEIKHNIEQLGQGQMTLKHNRAHRAVCDEYNFHARIRIQIYSCCNFFANTNMNIFRWKFLGKFDFIWSTFLRQRLFELTKNG